MSLTTPSSQLSGFGASTTSRRSAFDASATGALQLVARAIDDLGHRFLDYQVGSGGPADDHCGRSESLDPDNVGDIPDEGAGHRG